LHDDELSKLKKEEDDIKIIKNNKENDKIQTELLKDPSFTYVI
jgi:hypothetical protein